MVEGGGSCGEVGGTRGKRLGGLGWGAGGCCEVVVGLFRVF